MASNERHPGRLCILVGEPRRYVHKTSAIVREVEGGRCSNKDALMSEFAEALSFPDYFGRNWDALEECLADLSWLPSAEVVVVIRSAIDVCREDAQEFRTFIAVMKAATARGAGNVASGSHQRRLIIKLQTTRPQAPALRARLASIGFDHLDEVGIEAPCT